MLPISKVQTTINALGSAKTQTTLGMIVMKINDAVETNLHVIAIFTIGITTQQIDVTKLRHVNILHFGDLKFKAPGIIDILRGADVLEEVLLEK